MSKAHVLGSEDRTQDVQINEDVTFEGLILSDGTLKGLQESGFERPSPIQLVGIPLGKCGFDLIAEAKSGTGKTVMFGVAALEMLQLPSKSLQVLILTPTREIAAQVGDVLVSIGQGHEGLKIGVFIGGLPVEEDKRRAKNCHIAVGTPGRLKHLIDDGLLNVGHVRLVIIDEADKLLEPCFEPDISHIFKTLPLNKQVIAASATYTPELKLFLEDYMRSPIRVNPEEGKLDENVAVLLGVRQVAALVPSHPNYLTKSKNKLNALISILSSVPFKQCIVFNNSHGVAQTISETLNSKGWPTEFISSGMDQPSRLRVVKKFFDYECRILLSTDLVSRGIDVANVNLVVNLDVPMITATYLHRIGRSGRFGTQGLAITIVESSSKDLVRLLGIVKDLNITMGCIKIDSAKPFQENLFTCTFPTLQSEVPVELVSKVESPRSAKSKNDILQENESEVETDEETESSSSCEGVEPLAVDKDEEKDLPEEICKVMLKSALSSVKDTETNLEVELQKELAEMQSAPSEYEPQTPPKQHSDWRQNGHPPQNTYYNNNHHNYSPRSLPFASPRKNMSPQYKRNDYSPNFQRREYTTPSSSPYYTPSKDYSPSTRFFNSPLSSRGDSSVSNSPFSSPRKDFASPFSADKFVKKYTKFFDENDHQEFQAKRHENFTPRVFSAQQQQYFQQQFENSLRELMKDIRSYQPPKVEQVLGYEELEALSKQFDKSAMVNPAFERRDPYFNRKSILSGMGRHLGVLCNITKRHFVFNGGVKGYLQKLADGYEPKESDLPTWEPGADGFRVLRDTWVQGKEANIQVSTPMPPPEPQTHQPIAHPPPRPHFHRQMSGGGGDSVHLVVPPVPQAHHTVTFPPFPSEAGASLAEWKEKVKLATFMVHYSEYFRMMNKH
ncbi:probable ATP-dependent RNA helicase DDX20 [Neocloeon triangulifer]|uniref:probable ATP-dependent RNA helicase DDX20 n=1 Tax=Neocloeon triangulifer TaxID=2078957 RepID=UPI00286EDF83|nr:probable ATP-dependent RNA helicase DDX20 [Neocloeon triangulifer]